MFAKDNAVMSNKRKAASAKSSSSSSSSRKYSHDEDRDEDRDGELDRDSVVVNRKGDGKRRVGAKRGPKKGQKRMTSPTSVAENNTSLPSDSVHTDSSVSIEDSEGTIMDMLSTLRSLRQSNSFSDTSSEVDSERSTSSSPTSSSESQTAPSESTEFIFPSSQCSLEEVPECASEETTEAPLSFMSTPPPKKNKSPCPSSNHAVVLAYDLKEDTSNKGENKGFEKREPEVKRRRLSLLADAVLMADAMLPIA